MIAIDEIAKSLHIHIENADCSGDYPIFFSKIARQTRLSGIGCEHE